MTASATMSALERLKGAFPSALVHRVAVYVPSTVDRDKPTDNAQEVNALALMLSELVGGATACQCRGYWMPDAGRLVVESPTVVWANVAPDALDALLPMLWDYCESLAQRMGQDAVSLEFDGVMYFVKQGRNPWKNLDF